MESNETSRPIDYRAILEAMEAQYAALGRAIAEMRVVAGVSGPQANSEGNGSSGVMSSADVPAGAFHGKSIPGAAILYLRLVKQKQKTADIATALRKGGIDSKAQPEKIKGQIHSQLDRASKKEGGELVKVQGAYWALREWYAPNVRASMGAGSVSIKKKKKGKKKATENTAKPSGKVPSSPPTPITEAKQESVYRAPDADSTEGHILATMRRNVTKEWTPKEVSEIVGLPRVQTAHFLMGKMAHRGLIRKNDDGTYVLLTRLAS